MERGGGGCLCVFVFWNFDWNRQLASQRGCPDGRVPQLPEAALAARSRWKHMRPVCG